MSRYEAGKVKPGLDVLARLDGAGVDVLYVITGRRESSRQTPAGLQVQPPVIPTLAEPPARYGDPAPVSRDTTRPGALRLGGFTVTPTGALLAPAGGSNGPPLRLPVAFGAGQNDIREYQVIPRIKAAARAGAGRDGTADDVAVDPAGVLAMDRVYMRSELGADRSGFVSVLVRGDSMERSLIDGETIIIDSTIRDVDSSGIYALQVGKNLLVKRLVLHLDGSVLVKSDNPAYAAGDRAYPADQLDQIRIVGRMVWPRFR